MGYTEFICLNSNTDETYKNGSGTIGGFASTNDFLQAQADWLDRYLTELERSSNKPTWIIVYAHLSPMTVSRTKRLQRWIPVFEKHSIPLVLCG